MPNVYQSVLGGGGGVTPTNITPSDSSPAAMLQNGVYKALASGYAIESYQNITPSAEGASFNAGIAKMASGGYAYSDIPVISGYSNVASSASPNTRISTFTVSNKNGKPLLLLLFDARNAAGDYTKMDGATASGGTISKITNIMNANAQVQGTFYLLVPSSDTCTISLPTQGYVQIFEAS